MQSRSASVKHVHSCTDKLVACSDKYVPENTVNPLQNSLVLSHQTCLAYKYDATVGTNEVQDVEMASSEECADHVGIKQYTIGNV